MCKLPATVMSCEPVPIMAGADSLKRKCRHFLMDREITCGSRRIALQIDLDEDVG